MKTIVVFGGRFQPFHKGHKASYDFLVNKFGNNVYIASADKPPGPNDPFTWNEKKKLAMLTGIPSDKFVKVKNAYVLKFLQDAGLPITSDTVVILGISEKDGDRFISKTKDADGYAIKKNGERAAIQWLPNNPQPVSAGHIYAFVTPTLEFPILSQPISSATQIRDIYASSNDKKRQQILLDLYSKTTPGLKQLFDKKLASMQTESFLREFIEMVEKY